MNKILSSVMELKTNPTGTFLQQVATMLYFSQQVL
jgi:hypothetical protein